MALMTYSAYAKHRRISQPAVSQYVAKGRLAGALVEGENGRRLIDSAKADELLDKQLSPAARLAGDAVRRKWQGSSPESQPAEPAEGISISVATKSPGPVAADEMPAPPSRATRPKLPSSTRPPTASASSSEDDEPEHDFNRARSMTETYKARKLKLDVLERKGRLVPVEKVRMEAYALARATRDAILNVPNRIAAQLEAMNDAHAIHTLLTDELTLALEMLVVGGEKS